MPDIHFGGEAFPITIEPDPWEPPLPDELAALIGKPLPEVRLASTETTDVPLPLHLLSRGRILIIVVPQIATAKHPLPTDLAGVPAAEAGVLIQNGVHQEYENLAGIGFLYIFIIAAQAVDEMRQIIRPEPRRLFPGLSDPDLKLAELMGLPTFTVGDRQYYEPISLILNNRVVEKISYPIRDPAGYARWTFNWARRRRPDLDFLNYNMDRGAFTRKEKE